MNVTQRILLNPQYRAIAFCGGRSRERLMQRMTTEAHAAGKRVLVIAATARRLPARGSVVVGRSLSPLLSAVAEEFRRQPGVYAAKSIRNHRLQGFSLREVAAIRAAAPADLFLMDLGEALPAETMLHFSRSHPPPWDQLVYFLDISEPHSPTDHPPGGQEVSRGGIPTDVFTSPIPGEGVPGAHIFHQPWPLLVFLNQVNMPARENRAILLSRELQARGVQHVALGNLQKNFVKRLQPQ